MTSSNITSFTPLPKSLLNDFNEDKLIGNYTLQLVSIRDISIPQYNAENEFLRVEEEPEEGEDDTLKGKGKQLTQPAKNSQDVKQRGPRMLCLNLSDGKSIVKAIEYKPICTLKPDLPIGSRILIKGPVDVSFKVLFLKSQNIEVIGPPTPGTTVTNSSQKPKIDSPIYIHSQSTQSTSKSLSQKESSASLPNSSSLPKAQSDDDKSIVDISDMTDEHMYYLDGLDDEILE